VRAASGVVIPGGGGVDNADNSNMNAVEMETDMDDYPTMVSTVTKNDGTNRRHAVGRSLSQSIESE
jgi:hypothetical protein